MKRHTNYNLRRPKMGSKMGSPIVFPHIQARRNLDSTPFMPSAYSEGKAHDFADSDLLSEMNQHVSVLLTQIRHFYNHAFTKQMQPFGNQQFSF
jgi:hypothetical protein